MNGIFDPAKYLGQVQQVSEQYTKLPNFVIDNELMAQLSDKAFKCYMLITRYTTGYNKANAQIATATFQKYCGIKKDRNVFAAIKELEQCNLIKVERKTGVLNTYSLVQNQYPPKALPKEDTTTPKGQGTTTPKGQGTTTPKGGSYKENSKENLKENICEVFEFWKTTFGKTEKILLSDKRKTKIKLRLEQGYSVDDIKIAILNCSKSDYHVQNGYTDIELICREPEKLDRFIAMSKPVQVEQQIPQQREITAEDLPDL